MARPRVRRRIADSLIADSLASQTSGPVRTWLGLRPRFHLAFLPIGAAWRNRIAG